MRATRLLGCAMAALIATAGAEGALALDPAKVNEASFPAKAKRAKGLDPLTLRAQILLDRAHFSPGAIDGRGGESFSGALAAFRKANGLKEGKRLDEETWAKLAATSPEPALAEHTIAAEDLKGPFLDKVPGRMEEMVDLKALSYGSPLEALAERFHATEALLKALNPGKAFDQAGTAIQVPNVTAAPARKERVARIEVDKRRRELRALDKEGRLLAAYPASVGSRAKPAPTGAFKVTAVAENPTYTYDPAFAFKGVKAEKKFTIAPGPNNPVGSVWIDLSADTYGIHGTAEPEKVGKTASHGCVRLTNWDAKELAGMVQKGTEVVFVE